MSLKIVDLPTALDARKQNAVKVLEDMLERACAGEIESVEIIYSSVGGSWGTTASESHDVRLSAAMLMELAMRRLGFG